MSAVRRSSPLSIAAFAVVGASAGLLLQIGFSAMGRAPVIPPVSLALTLLVFAGVLLSLGIALRRAVTRVSGKPVNPFHAVRLLAGAQAGQLAGALIGGFGGGLALQLLMRSVLPPASSWMPMLLTLGAGIVLIVCAAITESLCRVPPGDNGDRRQNDGQDRPPASAAEPEPGPA